MTTQKFRKREKEVIEYLLEGKSNKQIAQKLGVSVRTVEFHLSNIYARLNVHSRTEAAIKLTEMNLRQPASSNTSRVLRKSTVAKKSRSVENGRNQSKRRFPMKNLLIGLAIGVTLTLLIAFALSYINGPVTGNGTGTATTERETPTMIPFDESTHTPVPLETATLIPTVTQLNNMETPTLLPTQSPTKVP